VAAACAKFESSHASEPSGGTLLNLADCRSRQGRTATAWAHFVAAERLSQVQGRPEQAAEAGRRRREVEPTLSTLTLRGPGKAAGLEVRVNGRPLSPGSFGSRLPMDPGTVTLEFSAPGHAPARLEVTLGTGTNHREVTAPTLVPNDAPPAASPVQASVALDRAERGPNTLAWVIGGAGVAALVVGGTFGILALSSDADAMDGCSQRTNACPQAALDAEEDRDRQALISTIGVATGVVGVGVASVLLLTTPSPGDQSAGVRGLRFELGPRRAVISGTARF
jgi:hypothetical protein